MRDWPAKLLAIFIPFVSHLYSLLAVDQAQPFGGEKDSAASCLPSDSVNRFWLPLGNDHVDSLSYFIRRVIVPHAQDDLVYLVKPA